MVVVAITFWLGTLLYTAFKKNGNALWVAYLVLIFVMSVVLWKVHDAANTSWKVLSIAIGGGMGIIMFMNVWMVIWPLQKKIIAATIAQGRHPAPPRARPGVGTARVSRVADEHVALGPDALLHGRRQPLPDRDRQVDPVPAGVLGGEASASPFSLLAPELLFSRSRTFFMSSQTSRFRSGLRSRYAGW